MSMQRSDNFWPRLSWRSRHATAFRFLADQTTGESLGLADTCKERRLCLTSLRIEQRLPKVEMRQCASRSRVNHLPGESRGPTRTPRPGDAGVIALPDDAGLEPSDVRSMPVDPRGGGDYGLEVAYDVLTKQLVGRGPYVR